jgi:choline dehydrogenase-like flavoprotein
MRRDAQLDADVVIVGSGVAGALIAARLTAAGARVRILEAGPRTDRAAAVRRYRSGQWAYESVPWAPQPAGMPAGSYYVQAGSVPFASDYERRVGGTTWHWLGNCPRLLPSDFAMQTRFGVGVDWPISYDDLEPWYVDAEHELGVSGNSSHDAGSPRSADFPMPAIPMSSGDAMFQRAAAAIGLDLVHTPQARNATPGYQGRPQCCGNATCIPVCPVQAKYDATYHLGLAERGGAILTENAVVSRVVAGDDGEVVTVEYLDPRGTPHTVTGRSFVLAANAIETAKLLLMSGIANSSDLVGRNLMDHPTTWARGTAAEPYTGYRGPLQTAGIDQLREGDFRSERGAFRVEVNTDVGSPLATAGALIGEGLVGTELFSEIARRAPFAVWLAVMIEQLPDPENRVTLADDTDALGLPRPKLTYAHSDYVMQGAVAAQETLGKLLDGVGATNVQTAPALGGAGHLIGTVRMGDDPATSVADSFGRTHDHPNLFLAGSGLFPTAGTANPTLTIAALALRSAARISRELGLMPVATPSASPTSPVATPG